MLISAEKDIAISFVEETDVSVDEIRYEHCVALGVPGTAFSYSPPVMVQQLEGKRVAKQAGSALVRLPCRLPFVPAVCSVCLLFTLSHRRPTARIKEAVYLLLRRLASGISS